MVSLPAFLICSDLSAANSKCTSLDYSKFDKELTKAEKEFASSPSGAPSWTTIGNAFRKIKDCDEGYVSEGLSDLVVKLFALRWTSSKDYIVSRESDHKFLDFILKHIDATADTTELRLAESNLKSDCPSSLKGFCSNAILRADSSLKELGATTKAAGK